MTPRDENGPAAEQFAEGVPCWVDAALSDVEAGKRFYGELFGWTFSEPAKEFGDYTIAYSDGDSVGALFPKRDGRMPTVWTVYLATPDAAALGRRVRDAGGTLVAGPLQVGEHGTFALGADPEGAVFGLWQGGLRPGFEKRRRPVSFCWTELYARDKSVVDPFYERVFGYGGFDVPQDAADPGEDYRAWSPAGAVPGPDTAIGGRSVGSSSFPAEMPPRFLVYFDVPDCDAAVATATRLGGRVQAAPRDIPYGRVAVLTDNQGADFALLQEP